MAKFLPRSDFFAGGDGVSLLPFRFERVSDGVIVSNFVGDLQKFTSDEFEHLKNCDFAPGDPLFDRAESAHLATANGNTASLQLLAMRMRSRMQFLRAPTALHMFVVSLRCEHSCPYCQVSRQSTDTQRFDMSEEVAERALAIALQSPPDHIKIEFQGGEPLLNFPLIKKIVAAAKRDAPKVGKTVGFVFATNLALLNDEVLDFCDEHEILISTSLDGPRDLHNKNRPRPGNNSYELAVDGIRRAQKRLGKENVGALMTPTETSLGRVEDIIDEYLALDLDGIFLRALSPYGFAIKTKQIRKYDGDQWLDFYYRGLRYILDLNKQGKHFVEFYTALILRRMLTDEPIGYVDLRSPAGIGLGALVYNYDGRVFASDEGRMLAEMGDNSFVLGDVHTHNYRSLVLAPNLVEGIASSLSQVAPECSSCVFEPICGADPVYHHATQGDFVGIKPLSGFCKRQKGVMSHIFDLLEKGGEDADILRNWISK